MLHQKKIPKNITDNLQHKSYSHTIHFLHRFAKKININDTLSYKKLYFKKGIEKKQMGLKCELFFKQFFKIFIKILYSFSNYIKKDKQLKILKLFFIKILFF